MRNYLGAFVLVVIAATVEGGDVRILTEPEGADVFQGSLSLGATTKDGLRLVGLEPGTFIYTIKKDGFDTVERAITVDSTGEPITILVRLNKSTASSGEAQPEASVPPVPPETAPLSREPAPSPSAPTPAKGKGASKGVLIGVGGGLAAAGIAIAASGGSSSASAPSRTPAVPARPATLADLSATVTSEQQNRTINCKDSVFITVSLTNRAPALVQVSGVRRHLKDIVGRDCGGAGDYVYPVSNPSVGTGTANVLTNQQLSDGIGCCTNGPCAGTCYFEDSFAVLTSVGEVNAGTVSYGIAFKNCPECNASAGFHAATCSQRE